MKQRKRMGLPTARIVVSPRLRAAEPPAVRPAVAVAPDASFADNTITKLMERLDDRRPREAASLQRRALPSGAGTFQPKVLRTRTNRA